METFTPLARALHLRLNSNIPDAGYALLAREILSNHQYDGREVMICWHHGKIPALARALGVVNAPKSRSGAVFDRVWRIRYSDGGFTLENLPQRLLPGDSPE